MSDIDGIIETGIVFRGALKSKIDGGEVETKAKEKKYITSVHGSGSTKQKAKCRQQRTSRHK